MNQDLSLKNQFGLLTVILTAYFALIIVKNRK